MLGSGGDFLRKLWGEAERLDLSFLHRFLSFFLLLSYKHYSTRICVAFETVPSSAAIRAEQS